jgi:hypothetical protein
MKENSQNSNLMIRKISSFLLNMMLLLVLLSLVLYLVSSYMNIVLNLAGLNITISSLLFIYTIIPGVMVWIKPSFSQFWLNALNKWLFPLKPWNELHPVRITLLYINSTLSLFMGIGIVYIIYEMTLGKLTLR